MKIPSNILKNISFIYIFLPIIFFILGYLKLYISIPLVLICIGILYRFIKNNKEESFVIPKKGLMIVIIISAIYIFLSGIGKFYTQPTFFLDHPIRNTIFRDLITKNWPVLYEGKTYLCYYIGQYIIPAIFGKMALGITANESLAYLIGNIFLYLYSLLGMILIFLWIFKTVGVKNYKKMFVLIWIFIFFSGLDIIGSILNKKFTINGFFRGFEWWLPDLNIQYSSFTSLIFWCYNQAFGPILILLMILNLKDYKNRIVLLVSGLLFGPYPMLGIGLFFLARDIISCILDRSFHTFKKYISLQNILTLIFIFPIILLFFKANARVTNPFESNILIQSIFKNPTIIYKYILFVLLEFLIYIFLIYRKNLKIQEKIDIYIMIFFLSLFPLVGKVDFVMRTSIPFLLILLIDIFLFLFDKNSNKNKKIILIILLMIASINPLAEFMRGFYDTYHQGYIGSQTKELNIMELDDYFRPQYTSCEDNIFFNQFTK